MVNFLLFILLREPIENLGNVEILIKEFKRE